MKGSAYVALIAFAAIVMLFAAFVGFALVPVKTQPYKPVEFLHKPKDRPIMESMPRVWEARHTGVCVFYFDGIRYEVIDLPKEYVDYAAWYVRLP